VFIRIKGVLPCGARHHDAGAAKRFFKHLLKSLQYVPRLLITDGLRSYACVASRC